MIVEEEPLDLAGFLRRQVLWMVLFAVVAGAAVAAWVASKPRVFASHSSVFVLGPSLPVVPDVVRDSLDLYRGLDNLESYLVSLLRSQSLRLSVAQRLKLAEKEPFWVGFAEEKNTQGLLAQMERLLTVESRRGLVAVTARTVEPELSRAMAQACLEELTSRLAARDTQRRDFLAKQLEISRERLRKSEEALRKYQESTGTLIPQEQQSTQEFAVLVDLGRELATAEVSLLSVERQLDAPGDIEKMQELESRRAGLQAQVERLSEMVASREETLRGVPGVAAQYIRLQRDVKVNEKVFELLTEQHEMARIEEARQEFPYRVVDRAMLPENPEPRRLIQKTLLATLGGLFFGMILGYLRESMR